jgi:cytochrome c-type biogenesis protein
MGINRVSQTNLLGAPALSRRFATFFHAVLFVLGFSLVFIVGWGGAATALGQLFGQYKSTLGQIGGLVVIVFGLTTLRILKIPWLYYDTRPQWNSQRGGGWLASGLMGVFFAAGWTPCIGTTLGAILTLGFSQQTAGQALVLTSGYALGLGLPFLAIGLAMERATEFVRRFRKHVRTVEIGSGLLLIVMGLLMVTGRMTLIAIWAQRNGLFLDLPFAGASAPTYLIAMLAGLISFLSPCVLPLVPAYVGYLSGQALGNPLKPTAG